MTGPLLEAEGLTKTYPGPVPQTVLTGVDLRLEAGAQMVVTGASGAGKSTLLHLLGGLDPPTSGKVLLGGEDLYTLNDEKLSRRRNEWVGFVFQFHHLLRELTASENVSMPLQIRGVARKLALREAREVLGRLGLEALSDKRPGELSGGEQQRVAVARAVVGRPRLILADEPTGNLDQANGEHVLQRLLDVSRQERSSLILVTHNEALAARFSLRGRLAAGRLQITS